MRSDTVVYSEAYMHPDTMQALTALVGMADRKVITANEFAHAILQRAAQIVNRSSGALD